MPRPAPVDPAPVEPPRRGFSRHATALAAVAAVAGGLFWLLTRDRGPSPESLHRRALELLDDTENEAAGRKAEVLAERLHAEGFRDREFPGGVEFILGIVAFREAVADSIAGEDVWRSVAERLREAERQAVPADRRPQWAFALGISLYHLGRSWEARPLLEEALQT
ncbi:MAG: hypothetical protein KY476_05235 [Planctomycetes bacterium]|nr:hypothetical protein [Planctomycetota bacterium]